MKHRGTPLTGSSPSLNTRKMIRRMLFSGYTMIYRGYYHRWRRTVGYDDKNGKFPIKRKELRNKGNRW